MIFPKVQNKKYNRELILTLLVLIFLILGLIISFLFIKKNKDSSNEEKNIVQAEKVEKPNPFEKTSVEAQAAIVKDLNTGEIYFSKNINYPAPLASLTKLMTAWVVYENTELNDTIQINFNDLATEGESGVYAGEFFSIKDLTDFMLVSSSNDAATSLSSFVGKKINPDSTNPTKTFVEKMNTEAKRIGMINTSFQNPTGLDKSLNEASAVGSISDLTLLIKNILEKHPTLLQSTSDKTLNISSTQGISHNVANTNEIVNILPSILGSKTGFTDLAGGNLAVVIDPGFNTPILIAVLGSSKEGRFTDVKKLSDILQNHFSSDIE